VSAVIPHTVKKLLPPKSSVSVVCIEQGFNLFVTRESKVGQINHVWAGFKIKNEIMPWHFDKQP
jgi:hypothetical protein